MNPIEHFGERQRELLRLLLQDKAGLTVEELSRALAITRNAVRQHLTGLERDGFVEPAGSRPTGGRPETLYRLSDKGREAFPRHYAWFAQLLLESVAGDGGAEALRLRLEKLGAGVAASLAAQAPAEPGERIARLATLMADLGYEARTAPAVAGLPEIEADNCVFHTLAERWPQVCHFDLALLSGYVGLPVSHEECMVRGGKVCRFRFGEVTPP